MVLYFTLNIIHAIRPSTPQPSPLLAPCLYDVSVPNTPSLDHSVGLRHSPRSLLFSPPSDAPTGHVYCSGATLQSYGWRRELVSSSDGVSLRREETTQRGSVLSNHPQIPTPPTSVHSSHRMQPAHRMHVPSDRANLPAAGLHTAIGTPADVTLVDIVWMPTVTFHLDVKVHGPLLGAVVARAAESVLMGLRIQNITVAQVAIGFNARLAIAIKSGRYEVALVVIAWVGCCHPHRGTHATVCELRESQAQLAATGHEPGRAPQVT